MNCLPASHLRKVTPMSKRLSSVHEHSGRAVLLLRDPSDAVASWWNHVRSGAVFGSGGMDRQGLRESVATEDFCRFAQVEVVNWRNLAMDVLAMTKDVLVRSLTNNISTLPRRNYVSGRSLRGPEEGL